MGLCLVEQAFGHQKNKCAGFIPWIMNLHHFVLGIFGKWKVGLSHKITINSNIGHKGKLNLGIYCCSPDQNTEGNLGMVKEIRDMESKHCCKNAGHKFLSYRHGTFVFGP